jgi:hypothetical protein
MGLPAIPPIAPGPVVLFGSGETSPSGAKVFDSLFSRLPPRPRVAVLETPAGFELNSAQVSQRVAAFLTHHLQNHQPQVSVLPARQRGTPCSPDAPEVVTPLLQSDLIFMGPGSPTYAVRQLQGSLGWSYLVARHRLGAALVLASAAVLAASAWTLPVYEIYKAGHELHWLPGLDLFGPYGLPVVFIPHWNNRDGGKELDTRCCFMGQERFERLSGLLPGGTRLVGIDEKTALILDLQGGYAQIMGEGGATCFQTPRPGEHPTPPLVLPAGTSRPLAELFPLQLPEPGFGLPAEAWQAALQARETAPHEPELPPPARVFELLQERETCRKARNWSAADRLRQEILAHGWLVSDTPDGPHLKPAEPSVWSPDLSPG